ncbi:hypothetical protein Tsubulata_029732 [Turnera subulata]|uniref:Transcriptional coactivator p15 (PC4) C-terminal domain-containing protein n=1 Tax=Turnera subulata TaxID=218843 RepID=A0A9Q0G6A6_9ROSI|nr:hypothetical protein Tsubulata_029732 [Turnera subulata]
MSWRGKRKDEEADDNSERQAPPKKASKTDSSDDADEIVVCEISKNRRVTVRNWQGKVWIDIREFYNKDGKLLPGKKGTILALYSVLIEIVVQRGISLSVDQWNILRDNVGEIDKALSES